jgi:hypothetical protein
MAFALCVGSRRIVSMYAFAHFAMTVLTVMFFVGLAGSSVVVIISFVEDLQELFGE